MATEGFVFSSEARKAYAPGTPVFVWIGDLPVGTVKSVKMSRDGGTVVLQNFEYSPAFVSPSIALRKLVFLELTAFLAQNAATGFKIVYRFEHRTTDDIDGVALANARAKMLEGMGATLSSVAPRVGSQGGGHFVVDATWQCNEASLAKLHAALAATRAENAKERSATWLKSLTSKIKKGRGA